MENEYRILIVDDDLSPLEGHIRLLRSQGYRVETAETGEAALTMAAEYRPHVILLDVVLPGINGYEACRRLKSEAGDKSPYIVLVSAAMTGSNHMIEGFESGADDYLSKPITRKVLLARVGAISRMTRAEEHLRQAQRLEAVGRLAGGVAHDFNNMLSIILGYSEMLQSEIPPDHPFHHGITEIRKAAERSADLTRQLLAFARKQAISPRMLDLNEAASSILKMLRRLIGEDIRLSWVPGPDLCPVKMDPAQIDQILANLAVNARDAIAGVGVMTIETTNVELDEAFCRMHKGSTPGRYVLLAVHDTGAGMDQETLNLIFEPFYTTKELGKGTGMGLATVYGIVQQNQGFIDVVSERGQGSTFRIYLPCAGDQPEDKTGRAGKRNTRGTETVLLVEDEESILELAKAILARRGYEVLAAHGPGEALKIAQCHPGRIDLLITDVVMPEMNGKELRDRLELLKPGFKCIFMSGYTADAIADRGVIDEGIVFLEKPFSVKTLTEMARDVLDD